MKNNTATTAPADDESLPLVMTAEEIAARNANGRPGFRLVDFDYVGLPVYRLDIEASFLDVRPISPIDEFVLRSVDAGLTSVDEIQSFLGLDPRVVQRSMVALARTEDLALQARGDDKRQSLCLTARGRATVDDLTRVVPTDHKVYVYYDGLLRRPVGRGSEQPLHPREIRDWGIREIPPIPSRPPALEDLPPREVFQVIRSQWSGAKRARELLTIKAIERRQMYYRRAVALIYRSLQGSEVQVAFTIDGRLSPEHERAFAINGGPEKTGIRYSVLENPDAATAKTFVGPAAAEASMTLAESEQLQRQLALANATADEARKEAAAATASADDREQAQARQRSAEATADAARAALETPRGRMISVSEHPPLLKEAITTSQKRLVIISPWIRAAVVDETFVRRLEERLQRGVSVYIGYGLGEAAAEERSRADERAEKELKRLAERYRALVLKRFGDTHAKVLICDDRFCVATSFNWLSFRGDPKRAFREELGYLVRNPQEVEEGYQLVLQRFDPSQAGPT